MILTDNETKVDLLNNEAIATTIIKLLRDRPDQPVVPEQQDPLGVLAQPGPRGILALQVRAAEPVATPW